MTMTFSNEALYLIEILHQTTTAALSRLFVCSCILSKFYIKPQLYSVAWPATWCCILSKFYIKPQLPDLSKVRHGVVSYRNSTSNHNWQASINPSNMLYLIEILHQTTTIIALPLRTAELYLIEILHQTTTGLVSMKKDLALYLIEILHQTTTED